MVEICERMEYGDGDGCGLDDPNRIVRIYSVESWSGRKKTHAFMEIPNSLNLELVNNKWSNLGGSEYMPFVEYLKIHGARMLKFDSHRINEE